MKRDAWIIFILPREHSSVFEYYNPHHHHRSFTSLSVSYMLCHQFADIFYVLYLVNWWIIFCLNYVWPFTMLNYTYNTYNGWFPYHKILWTFNILKSIYIFEKLFLHGFWSLKNHFYYIFSNFVPFYKSKYFSKYFDTKKSNLGRVFYEFMRTYFKFSWTECSGTWLPRQMLVHYTLFI